MGLRQKITDSQFYRDLVQRRAIGALRTYYDVPAADPTRPIMDTEFIALDLETTGLDPKRDEIVSLGWVIIRQLGVDFSSCEHILVRPTKELTESSVVGLRDLHRQGQPFKSGALKLDNLRRSHNLPPFRAHNALSDAIAASGLFLAQVSKRDPKGVLELRRVLR